MQSQKSYKYIPQKYLLKLLHPYNYNQNQKVDPKKGPYTNHHNKNKHPNCPLLQASLTILY